MQLTLIAETMIGIKKVAKKIILKKKKIRVPLPKQLLKIKESKKIYSRKRKNKSIGE
jgi:hypothetical protein